VEIINTTTASDEVKGILIEDYKLETIVCVWLFVSVFVTLLIYASRPKRVCIAKSVVEKVNKKIR